MIGTRTKTRHASRPAPRAARLALLLGAVAAASCGSTPASNDGDRPEIDLPPAPVAVTLRGRSVGPVQFRAYDGRLASDARLVSAIDRMAAAVEPTIVAAENRAGVALLPDRDAVVTFSDEPISGGGDVNMRLVDGVRRPVIRVDVRALAAGEFLPDAHFRPLLVAAAVAASAGDRVPPAWLRAGLGPEITETFDRVLHERALGGAAVRANATALFPPTPSNDDPLRAAARVRALERIARGERPLARFVAARLEGLSEAEALGAVGVQDALFLEAAAETERDRALAALVASGPLEALDTVRVALEQGDPGRAAAQVALLERELGAGTLSPWVAADSRLVLAQYALVVGDQMRARQLSGEALATPEYLVRVRDARLCEARAARALGDRRGASRLYRAYLTDFPGARGQDEAMEALGVSAELAARLPQIASELTSEDPSVRGRAAVRLGETGDAMAAEPLRRLTGDDDATVRRFAYAALALAVGEEAIDDLEIGTRDPDPSVRGAALSLLAFADVDRGENRARELETDAAPEVKTVVDRILAPTREREAEALQAELARKREEMLRAERERSRAAADAEKLAAAERAAAERAAAEKAAAEKAAQKQPDPAPPKPPVRTDGTGTPPKPAPPDRVRDSPLPPPRPPRPLPAPKPSK